MHYAVLVIGDNPLAQLDARRICDRSCGECDEIRCQIGIDWAAIGGRYTGTLVLRPGAVSGTVYGDAVPDVEAALTAMGADRGLAVVRTVPGVEASPAVSGVDQALARDVDWEASSRYVAPVHVVIDGVWHDPDDMGALFAASAMMAAWAVIGADPDVAADRLPPADLARLESGLDASAAWDREIGRIVGATPADALVTVVDVHS